MIPGWNDNFTHHDDWSHVDFVGMFWEALLERLEIYNALSQPWSGGKRRPAVGDYVGSATTHIGTPYSQDNATPTWGIRALQETVEAMGNSAFTPYNFARTNLNLSQHATPTYTSLQWSLADWRAAAGIPATGFTRKFPAGVGNGLIEPGDYIGPWIWTELRDGMNQLVHTVNRIALIATPQTPPVVPEWYGGAGDGATYAEAIANMQADWHNKGFLAAILAYVGARGSYRIFGNVIRGQYRSQLIYADLKHTAELWLFASKTLPTTGTDVDVFEDFGEGLTEDRWNLIDSYPPGNTAQYTSHTLNAYAPTPPSLYPSQPPPDQIIGYGIPELLANDNDAGALIAKWDVVGGLTHQAATP